MNFYVHKISFLHDSPDSVESLIAIEFQEKGARMDLAN
jgi:hypothetical protein